MNRRSCLAVFLLLQTLSSAPVQSQSPGEDGRAPNSALSRRLLPGTQELQLIVELQSPSVVEWMRAQQPRAVQTAETTIRQPRVNLQSTQALSYRQELARERQLARDQLAKIPNLRIEGELDTVMNALIVRVPPSEYLALRNVPSIKKLYFSHARRPFLDAAASIVSAQDLWDKAGGRTQAGAGIKIGIVDSGIDISNPMFTGNSLVPPSGFPKGESSYTNHKVIVARNYVNLLPSIERVQTAADEVGHGTFVAGVAAGELVQAPLATISGMAPGAFLGNYKVFGTPGINDFTTDAAVIAAVNAAVLDGMDVINLSLGALDYVPPGEDPEAVALQNAVNSGVVVTVAAGNDGPYTHTIGSPATAPDVIAVGSVSNSRAFFSQIHVTAPSPVPATLADIQYLPGTGPAITSAIPSSRIVDAATLDGDGLGCNGFPGGSVSGQIAFIARGQCTFAVKVANAAAAGALAAIVYNNEPNGGLISMGGLESTRIPSLMISNANGLVLKDFIDRNPATARVAIDSSTTPSAKPIPGRILSSFSSLGPSMDFGIKPDLVAVGGNIYSAAQTRNPNGALYDPSGFTLSSGTSFTAPMVAGAAAGLRQLFPGLGPLEIKSLLTSTANRNLTADGTAPPNVVQAGSGLLDMAAAASANAVFSPTSLSFGVQSYTGTLSLSQTFTITNISPKPDQYVISVAPIVTGPGMTLSRTETGSLAPNQTSTVELDLQAVSPQTGGFQGFVLVQSSTSGRVYTIPYWVGLYVLDPSRVLSVSASSAADFRTLDAALASARPGNVIEIADSSRYPVGSAGLIVATNSEGLPLHGITIRARAGQRPVIDGTSADAFTDIGIIGLQNVLLQGLTIDGGITGVTLLQPSSTLPTSATIDQTVISNITTSGSSAAGIYVDGPRSIRANTPPSLTLYVTRSTITGSSGPGIVAGRGSQLTVLGSIVQNNLTDGADGFDANVDVLNSTVSGNRGPGLNLDACSGTIDGNSFSQNTGSFGDGIEISDGQFSVSGNSFEANARAGIFLSDHTGLGPTITITRNILRANTRYGVRSDNAESVVLDSNLIKDNGEGVRLAGNTSSRLINNIIVGSTSSVSGYGIELADSSNALIVGNTIYRNASNGIRSASSTPAMVYNTIVSSSGSSDIVGLTNSAVQYSLVGDGGIIGSNNLNGDPKFSNPAADDFTLAQGSPAIDAGLNAAPGLPFVDFKRQFRVAPGLSSGVAGEGKVDMGAEEASSRFPLIFPLLANGSQPALGDSFSTGFAILNANTSPANLIFSAYNPSGSLVAAPRNPTAAAIRALSQFPTLAFQMLGTNSTTQAIGAVLAASDLPVSGFSLLFDSDFKRFADGVNAANNAANDLVFMRQQSDAEGKANFILFNPGVNPANVTATLYSSGGSQLDSKAGSIIPPKGQLVFGFASQTASSGSVRVRSDRPISGFELVGDAQRVAALPGLSPSSEARLFFPHFAVNGGFSTLIGIVNGVVSRANVALTAYDDNGQQIGNPVSVSLGPREQSLNSVGTLLGISGNAVRTGYIIAESDEPGIQGFTQFDFDDGVHRSSAAVPADSVPTRNLLFSHIANQVPAGTGTYQTGIALLNPFNTPVNYTLKVFDINGIEVAEKTAVLGPAQKLARVLSYPDEGVGFFTVPLVLGGGHIEVQSDYALFGFELFFTEDFAQMAGVPAQK